MNINDIGNFSWILYYNILSKVYKLIFDEFKISRTVIIKINKGWLGKNLKGSIILYYIKKIFLKYIGVLCY